jgi:hypothetical protein
MGGSAKQRSCFPIKRRLDELRCAVCPVVHTFIYRSSPEGVALMRPKMEKTLDSDSGEQFRGIV